MKRARICLFLSLNKQRDGGHFSHWHGDHSNMGRRRWLLWLPTSWEVTGVSLSEACGARGFLGWTRAWFVVNDREQPLFMDYRSRR